ncbi:MAG: CidA/LrgA family protein [Desulfovibrio sp.]|nr:CidA/LrgA family protein [Desulfovibrio sp.]MBI4960865.1 CidA/LrgA family protein [Desulfovibrio sp.]
MRWMLKLILQTILLCAIYWGSRWLVDATGLPLPGNVVGVVVLFTLLCLGVIKLEHIAGAADFLLKHLVFFFVPITVGLMEWGGVFKEHWLVLLTAVVVSSLVPLWLVGFVTQWLHKRRGPCDI